ncbi:MAG: rod shape-determining protein MreC, partial [Verrucomicrobiales bacterium]
MGWFSPVVKASGVVHGEMSPPDPRTREELLVSVKKLEEEAFSLEFRQLSMEELEAENARLREALEFKKNKRYSVTIPAQVIERTRTSWWSTVTINRGTKQGVGKDSPVISRDHAVVGKVTPNGLTEDTAEVLLLTDEQCKVAAHVGRNVSMQGLVMGRRGMGNLAPEVWLTNLKSDLRVPAGAVLFTDDFDGQV